MTRMLVPPLRERKGRLSDLHGCTGATMWDGTVYRANRAGAFDCDDPGHVRDMRTDPAIAGDIVAETFHARTDRPGRYCDCGSTELWPWTRVCPRCGGPTHEREP